VLISNEGLPEIIQMLINEHGTLASAVDCYSREDLPEMLRKFFAFLENLDTVNQEQLAEIDLKQVQDWLAD
jgi:hypothetical protein